MTQITGRLSIHIFDWAIRIICLLGLFFRIFLYRHMSFIDLYNTNESTKYLLEFIPYTVFVIGFVSTFIYERYYLFLIGCLFALLGMLAFIMPPLASLWLFYILWFIRYVNLKQVGARSRVPTEHKWWFEKR